MVNRQNYQYARQYLDYLADVTQLDRRSVDRYWFHLKHFLIWADETALGRVAGVRPAFPAYLTSARLDGAAGSHAPSTLKKIMQPRFAALLAGFPHRFNFFARDGS